MSTILITGASGFIGSHVLQELGERGDFDVHAVSRGPTQSSKYVTWHACDLLEPGSSTRLVKRVRPTHLLHLAWYAIPGKYMQALDNISWVRASVELMEAFCAAGGHRIVSAGSCLEYDWRYGLCSESITPLSHSSAYAAAKNAFRELLGAYAGRAGISWAWGRVFFVYGPGEPQQKLVASVITSLLNGRPANCSVGLQMRDYLHVRDVADAFVTLLGASHVGEVNIGSGTAIQVAELVKRIGHATGRGDLIRLGAIAGAYEAPLVIADTQRARESLCWQHRVDLDQGLDETVNWWKGQR